MFLRRRRRTVNGSKSIEKASALSSSYASEENSALRRLNVAGTFVTPATMDELHREISRLVETGGPAFVLSGNVHGINTAKANPWLQEFYNRANAVRVDGAGVVWAARLLGHKIPPRITWADWGAPLARHIADRGHSLFLLGGPDECAQATADIFTAKNPSLRIVGVHHGFFAKEGPENDRIIKMINDAGPDILIVGFGMPLQERWLLNNYKLLNVKVYLTSGAAFEFLSGKAKRCPKWMGRAGFEWLFRFLMEPRRMAKRYLWGNPAFFASVIAQRITANGK
ncbi:MAG: WecB/TagA/CpsF family glycosyltransferase [Chitinivibrionales bacterium]|nr:WecB/TagA/CpsF family glycosyltransferase [Chitinivibrionales bacterium]MBD3357183.1 WecB/TagA/CpsF family glycosyltransferase [Chitinivibrionales bacterium]